ncbi:hypothetical protein EMIHUDRAFT_436463 [Emiliania huxleyi CCMP1516]|uniref:Replication factor-A protein 1 N-terminal domain-containing protein n=2 Tax=Emiliania huxleyi TaxID=2903 RepID=A0A0D3IZT6_EMIH1|nr:hypothetical protein EMIHUDRAFT_436463 [Emiliania huxleyi CCMP1516]EOD16771.1 hypothetical protein EMIHUDRAFT_436463 [Emiliania huxleyi CCMP1516]|eukprot:XP_005769200.1 hypothetical protein EMIHUDRAFT_436463 [Emiliania huxleyi CCMP1516]
MAAPNAAVQPHYVQVLDLCARQDGAQNCVLSDGARSIGAVLDASCVAAFEQTNVLERLQGAIILPGKEDYQIMVNNVLGQFNMRVLAFRYEGADDSGVLGAPRSVMEAPAVRDKFAALQHGCARPPAEGRGAASRGAASQQAPQEALVRRAHPTRTSQPPSAASSGDGGGGEAGALADMSTEGGAATQAPFSQSVLWGVGTLGGFSQWGETQPPLGTQTRLGSAAAGEGSHMAGEGSHPSQESYDSGGGGSPAAGDEAVTQWQPNEHAAAGRSGSSAGANPSHPDAAAASQGASGSIMPPARAESQQQTPFHLPSSSGAAEERESSDQTRLQRRRGGGERRERRPAASRESRCARSRARIPPIRGRAAGAERHLPSHVSSSNERRRSASG